jgi:hypothetical protein|tara:strand:+ start:375 stop:746 length:372 start_codon:yes stop_codon:yes gene_type:complete
MNEISKYMTTDGVNTNGSSRVGSLNHMGYKDIVKRVGPPTINYDGAHDKVNVEWIFKVNGDIFTLYDYKSWSETYTFDLLNHWSVGGFENTDENMQILIDYLVLWTDQAKIYNTLKKNEKVNI